MECLIDLRVFPAEGRRQGVHFLFGHCGVNIPHVRSCGDIFDRSIYRLYPYVFCDLMAEVRAEHRKSINGVILELPHHDDLTAYICLEKGMQPDHPHKSCGKQCTIPVGSLNNKHWDAI